jgi:hypothetical protein
MQSEISLEVLLTVSRIHTLSPIRGADGDEPELLKSGGQSVTFTARNSQQQKTLLNWSTQWKSIIMSSLGKTAYPYCLYIQSLELSNLQDLLSDPKFSSVHDNFFAGNMADFLITRDTPIKQKSKGKKRPPPRLAATAIVELVGESISRYAGEAAENYGGTVALETLSGHIERLALTRWVARLSRLKSLSLWDGVVLNKDTADAITSNCRDFIGLTMFLCSGNEVDTDFSSFLNGLRPNSLQFLQMIRYNNLAAQTFSALSNHGGSLRELSLGSLKLPALKVLPLLKDCTALQLLSLEYVEEITDLESTENDVFLEIVAWLVACTQLKQIVFKNFPSGHALLTSICLQDKIKLDSIELVGYNLLESQEFHRALSHQTSLESLILRSDGDSILDDTEVLISSLCKLINLTYLNLIDTSDDFTVREVKQLAMHLKNVRVTLLSPTLFDSTYSSL